MSTEPERRQNDGWETFPEKTGKKLQLNLKSGSREPQFPVVRGSRQPLSLDHPL